MLNIFILVLLFASAGCKSNEKTTGRSASGKDLLRAAISEKLGGEQSVELIYNQDSTLLLCKKVSEITPREPIQSVRFFVYNKKEQAIIFEDMQKHAQVEWFDKDRLRIVKIPEMIRSDNNPENYTFLLDPETQHLRQIKHVEAAK